MAFCTAADVETFALIDFHSDLESHLTNELIPVVEDAIREYVGYTVDYGTYTETFSGNQTREYFLDERPVNAVTSVVEDGTTLEYGNQKDFLWYKNGRIRRIGSRWSFAYPDNITVSYTAGYDTGGGYGVALPNNFRVVAARASARLLESALVLSAQQEPSEIVAQKPSATQVSNNLRNLENQERELITQLNVPQFRDFMSKVFGPQFGAVMEEAIPEPEPQVSPQRETPPPTQGEAMMTTPPSQ